MNLKPIDAEVVERLEKTHPKLFGIYDGDQALILFKMPGKLENRMFRKQTMEGTKGADMSLLLSCVVEPPAQEVERAFEEDVFLQGVVQTFFIQKLAEPYKNLNIK